MEFLKKNPAGACLAALVTILTAWRIFVSGRVPLTADEAYFWEWSRNLAWGYHDQPPLIAWLTALTVRLAGATETGVRLSGPLLSAGTAWAVYRLAREISGSREAGAAAGALILLAPLFGLGGMMLTVENPLAFSWTLTMLFSWRALGGGRAARWWLAAGAAFGLGMLGKYNIILMLPCAGLFFLLSAEHRRLLRRPEPWLGLAVSLALFWPVVAWNARHDWVNFRLNFLGRRDFSLAGSGFNLEHLLEFPAGQALALSPVLFALALWATWRCATAGAGRARDTGRLFLFCFSGPVFLFYALAGFLDRIALHWPATGYIAALAALPALAREKAGSALFRRAAATGAVLLVLMSATVHLLPAFPGLVIAGERALRGEARPGRAGSLEAFFARWPETLGRRVVEVRDEMARERPGQPVFILCRGFSTASYLAFYAPGQPETLAVFQASPQGQDHLFWQDLNARVGHDAVFVIEKGDLELYFEKVRGAFESVEPEPVFRIEVGGRKAREFEIWRCRGFRGLAEGEPPGRIR